MSEPSKQVIDFTNKVYDDIDNDRFGFDPLLVMAIANIIMNIIKAIKIIYFSTSPKFIKKGFEKQGLMMRMLMRREARKALKLTGLTGSDEVKARLKQIKKDFNEFLITQDRLLGNQPVLKKDIDNYFFDTKSKTLKLRPGGN